MVGKEVLSIAISKYMNIVLAMDNRENKELQHVIVRERLFYSSYSLSLCLSERF